MAGRTLTIPLHIPLTYNEGWNAYFAVRAVDPNAGPLYPPPGSFVFNNYPPLSFYLVGMVSRLTSGDMIVAGRIVALACLLLSAGFLGLCVRRLAGCGLAAMAASMLALLFACTFYHDYLATDDPQWLAHACMLGGLAILLRRGVVLPLARRDVVLAALLMLAGGFVKHNLVALPLAVTVWLAWRDRAGCAVWLAAAALGLGGGAVVADMFYGPAVFADVLQHQRIIRLHRLVFVPLDLLPLLPMVLAGFAGGGRALRGDPAHLLVVLFAAISVVVGVAERLGEGVNYNAYFEAMTAVCLACGLAIGRSFESPPRPWGIRIGPAGLAAFAALPLMVMLPAHARRAWHDSADATSQQRASARLIASIARAPGPAMCETLALCYWAGKPFTVDLFNLSQSVLAGNTPPELFRSAVAAHRFSVVEYQLASSIHADVVRRLGSDPIESAFVGQCSVLAIGPHGMVVIRPGA